MPRNLRVFAMVAALLLASSPLQAGDGSLTGVERDQEVQGLLFLRIPFGQDKSPARPSVGVDLDVRSESERQYEQESYDPKSGRRIPSQDPDKVRTWELE
ncbi:MAG: hypothetical protein QNI93_17965 [Kiloniellales bacterium]|nr:hypothetical protein [Kiloniellales bacterium]